MNMSDQPPAKGGLDELDAIGKQLIQQHMPIDMQPSGQTRFLNIFKMPKCLCQVLFYA